jgi:hypothetical protein
MDMRMDKPYYMTFKLMTMLMPVSYIGPKDSNLLLFDFLRKHTTYSELRTNLQTK